MDPEKNLVLEALIWSKSGVEMELKIASKTASSSVYEFGLHKKYYPEIDFVSSRKLLTSRLDEIVPKNQMYEFLVMDVQGAELEVLKSLGTQISKIKWIFTEVSKLPIYQGAASYKEVFDYLISKDFSPKFEAWDKNSGWGDVLFVRKSIWKFRFLEFLGRRFVRMYYQVYWRIPQRMFPVLVKLKAFFHFRQN